MPELRLSLSLIHILSNASEKSLERVSKITGKPVKFYKADILDRDALNEIFDKEDIDSCIDVYKRQRWSGVV